MNTRRWDRLASTVRETNPTGTVCRLIPPMPDDAIDDYFACEILETIMRDREAGRLRSLSDYQELFAGHEALVADEWRHVFGSITPAEGRDDDPTCGLEPGTVIDGLVIESFIARGGQGVVARARDDELQRTVAIKILPPLRALSSAARKRFEREGRLAARLDHPGICRILARGFHHGLPYIVMPFIEGRTLADEIRRLPTGDGHPALRSPSARAFLATRIADAIAHVHDAGVIHRDLKPANVMVTPGGDPVVLDLGLGRDVAVEDTRVTRTGDVVGTTRYMAPERLEAPEEAPTFAVDVFSLGVILLDMFDLTRRTADEPGPGRTFADGPASFPPGFPRGLRPVVARCLRASPEDRYPDVASLRDDLMAFAEGRPVSARSDYLLGRALVRLRTWRTALLFALAVAATATIVWRRGGNDDPAAPPLDLNAVRGAWEDGDAGAALEKLESLSGEGRPLAARVLAAAIETERVSFQRASANPPRENAVHARRLDRLARLVSVPGRSGPDVVVSDGGSSWSPRRLSYEGHFVTRLRWSRDARRLAVVSRPEPAAMQQSIDWWSVVDGTRIGSAALGTDPVTALDELRFEGWLIGRASGVVELWRDGRRVERRFTGIKPVHAIQGRLVHGSSGVAVRFAADVAHGARRFRFGLPWTAMSFQEDGLIRLSTRTRWTAVIDPLEGRVISCEPTAMRDPVRRRIPERWRARFPKRPLGWVEIDARHGVSLHEDRLRFHDLLTATPTLELPFEGTGRCLAYDPRNARVAVATTEGDLLLWGVTPWTPRDAAVRDEWDSARDTAARAFRSGAHVPLAGVASPAARLAGLWIRTPAGTPSLGSAGFVPGSPTTWDAFQAAMLDDTLAADPDDHGAAVRRVAIGIRRGEWNVARDLLLRPPLRDSTAPTVHLLRALRALKDGDEASARAALMKADDAATRAGRTGSGFAWLRAEVAAAFDPVDRIVWDWLKSAVTAGLEDPASWTVTVRRLPDDDTARERIEEFLGERMAIARTVAREAGRALSASEAPDELHAAAAKLTALAHVVAADDADVALACERALGALRTGDLAGARTLIDVPPVSPEVFSSHPRHLLILTLVRLHAGDTAGAEAAYNRAVLAAQRPFAKTPDVILLLHEADQRLRP